MHWIFVGSLYVVVSNPPFSHLKSIKDLESGMSLFPCYHGLFLSVWSQENAPYRSVFLISCCAMIITCAFSCCFQMPRRGWPKGSPWTASSITPRCCSARRMTCCMWALGRSCSPSACRTSARPNCRRTYVRYLVKCGIAQSIFFFFFFHKNSTPGLVFLTQLWLAPCAWLNMTMLVFSFPSSADVGYSSWKKGGMQLQRKEPGGERSHLWKIAL